MRRPEPLEIEVKFAVWSPDLVRQLITRPPLDELAGFRPAGPSHLVVITDRYLDTKRLEGALALAGMRARVREGTDGSELHVKRRGIELDGITSRVELTGPASPTDDPSTWPPSDAQRALVEAIGDRRVIEVAAIRQRRLTRMFANDGSSVEMSLDEVAVLASGRVVAHRHELEVELKRGAPTDLGALASALGRLDGLGPPYGSKLEFALATIDGRGSG